MKKTALITGATSGIGRATAVKFAEAGINLILCGRRKDRLKDIKQQLSTEVKVTTLSFDVRDQEEVKKKIDSISKINIDILVNNAGNAHGRSHINEGDLKDWDAMIDGNVKGLLYVSNAVIPSMVSRKNGHIVNISSVAGKQTYEFGAVYCASKKAVEAISEGMRLDLTQHGIKVTNIAPGAVETEFSEVRYKGDKEKAKKVYEGFEPLKAVDIAEAILFAVTAPNRVSIADMTIYAKAQSAPAKIYKE